MGVCGRYFSKGVPWIRSQSGVFGMDVGSCCCLVCGAIETGLGNRSDTGVTYPRAMLLRGLCEKGAEDCRKGKVVVVEETAKILSIDEERWAGDM